MKRLYIPLVLLLLMIFSCNRHTIYEYNLNIPNEQWEKDMPACFNIPITDTTCYCDMFINIRNTTEYDFSNLYIFVTMQLPDGRMARDTINCLLADKEGRWLGKGIGNIKEQQIAFRSEMIFPRTGVYKFYIEQAMRTDTLKGIKSIGIRLNSIKI